jgi:D-alanyl-D-alanine endopeptidase (penicillin-binding protein 7)
LENNFTGRLRRHPTRGAILKRLILTIALACAVAAPAWAANARARHVSSTAEAAAAHLNLKSSSVLVLDQRDGRALYGKNTEAVVPIASITKLMTAMVVLDAKLPMEDQITVTDADVDELKHTRSRLHVGTTLRRDEMLRIALMASENRAAASLGRNYPGGIRAFVAAMNQKAVELGMWHSRFVDSTGLSSDNVSTASDLAKMVQAAYGYSHIREYTTDTAHSVVGPRGRRIDYRNSNGLVKSAQWRIGLSKTGYISEAGRCLVMLAWIAAKPVVIVLLDSWGTQTRRGDANRIKKWIESQLAQQPAG